MRVVEDLSLINDQVLDIMLLTDSINTPNDPDAFGFTWSVTQFEERHMKIQIYWDNIYQISAGSNRDILQV